MINLLFKFTYVNFNPGLIIISGNLMHYPKKSRPPVKNILLVNRCAFLLVFFMLISFLTSCKQNPWKRTVVYSNAGTAIYREKKFNEEGKQVQLGYQHPINLSPAQIREVFYNLKFFRGHMLLRKELIGDIFTEEQIDKLSEPLANALQDLPADERLRFLSVEISGKLFLAHQSGTSGVIFANEPNKIDIVFDTIDSPLSFSDSNPKNLRLDLEPTELEEANFRLILPEGIQLKENTRVKNWLIYDPEIPIKVVKQTEQIKNGKLIKGTREFQQVNVEESSGKVVEKKTASATESTSELILPSADKNDISEPHIMFEYKGFNVIEYNGEYYGLAKSEGPLDSEKLKTKNYKTLFEKKSVQDVIETIDTLLKTIQDNVK